jgi:hypothetical protein
MTDRLMLVVERTGADDRAEADDRRFERRADAGRVGGELHQS